MSLERSLRAGGRALRRCFVEIGDRIDLAPATTGTSHAGRVSFGTSLPSAAGRPDAVTASPPGPPDTIDLGNSATRAHMRTVVDGTKLVPNTTIRQNGYTFTTDAQGRLSSASADRLELKAPGESHRLPSFQVRVGGPDRLSTDIGGHLIGDQFRGPGYNLFPQNTNFNNSAYKMLENTWKDAIDRGETVQIHDARLTYDGPSSRPTTLRVDYSIAGERTERRFFNAPGGVEPRIPVASDSGALRAVTAHATATDIATGSASRTAAIADSQTGMLRALAADAPTTSRLSAGLDGLSKVALPLGVAASAYELGSAFHADGNTVGTHTVEATGSVAGGWVGAEVGASVGAETGAAVGAVFGGVGAVPGAVIGGLVGGAVGGIAGSSAGKALADGAISAGKAISHAASSIGSFISSIF